MFYVQVVMWPCTSTPIGLSHCSCVVHVILTLFSIINFVIALIVLYGIKCINHVINMKIP